MIDESRSQSSKSRVALAIAAALVAPVLLAYSGVTVQLGAHPRWAASSAWIGVATGASAALILALFRFHRGWAIMIAMLATALAGATAYFGKDAFVSSYAANAFAGRLWYYGWIGVAAGTAGLMALVILPGRKRNRPGAAAKSGS